MRRQKVSLPVTITATLKGSRPVEFECFAYRIEGGFLKAATTADDGRQRTILLAMDQVTHLQVDEIPRPAWEPQQQQLQQGLPVPPSQPVPLVQAPQPTSYSPPREVLRSVVHSSGIPMSEVEGGGIVPAGFLG